MSVRISEKMLGSRIDRLNKITGNRFNFTLEMAYGGYSLSMHNGRSSVFNCGYTTKRDLFNRILAYMEGIDLGIGLNKNDDEES